MELMTWNRALAEDEMRQRALARIARVCVTVSPASPLRSVYGYLGTKLTGVNAGVPNQARPRCAQVPNFLHA